MISKNKQYEYKCPFCYSKDIQKTVVVNRNKGACSKCDATWNWKEETIIFRVKIDQETKRLIKNEKARDVYSNSIVATSDIYIIWQSMSWFLFKREWSNYE